jgi:hypothetical protein
MKIRAPLKLNVNRTWSETEELSVENIVLLAIFQQALVLLDGEVMDRFHRAEEYW